MERKLILKTDEEILEEINQNIRGILNTNRIYLLSDLIKKSKSELLSLPYITNKVVEKISDILNKYNLKLYDEVFKTLTFEEKIECSIYLLNLSPAVRKKLENKELKSIKSLINQVKSQNSISKARTDIKYLSEILKAKVIKALVNEFPNLEEELKVLEISVEKKEVMPVKKERIKSRENKDYYGTKKYIFLDKLLSDFDFSEKILDAFKSKKMIYVRNILNIYEEDFLTTFTSLNNEDLIIVKNFLEKVELKFISDSKNADRNDLLSRCISFYFDSEIVSILNKEGIINTCDLVNTDEKIVEYIVNNQEAFSEAKDKLNKYGLSYKKLDEQGLDVYEDVSLEQMNFHYKTVNILKEEGVTKLSDILKLTKYYLYNTKNLGIKPADTVVNFVSEKNLSLLDATYLTKEEVLNSGIEMLEMNVYFIKYLKSYGYTKVIDLMNESHQGYTKDKRMPINQINIIRNALNQVNLIYNYGLIEEQKFELLQSVLKEYNFASVIDKSLIISVNQEIEENLEINRANYRKWIAKEEEYKKLNRK